MRTLLAGLVALAILPITLLGCEVGAPASEQEAHVQRPTEPTLEPWPFNVTSVVLECENPARKVFVTTANGQRYAVNGTARADAPLMRDIQAEMDLEPLIRMGLGLCDRGEGPITLIAPPPQVEAPGGSLPIAPLRIEPVGYGDGVFFHFDSDQIYAGARPQLSISCERDRPPMIQFDLITAPRTPPPLRGVDAYVRTDRGTTVEMSYFMNGVWTLRSGDTRELDTELVRQMIESNRFELGASNRYMPRETFVWRVHGAPEDVARFRSLCG